MSGDSRPAARLFLDESGDHTTAHETDVGKRYIGLVGAVFSPDSLTALEQRMHKLKTDHFPDLPPGLPILHRKEIVRREGCYVRFEDEAKRTAFNRDILELFGTPKFMLLGVVVDKFTHLPRKYRSIQDPYHYAIQVMLERYCKLLDRLRIRGDVVAEARGKKEDRELKNFYRTIYESGQAYLSRELAQRTLTSRDLKMERKAANVPGLQLADLLAANVKIDVLRLYGKPTAPMSPFSEEILRSIQSKYHTHRWGGWVKGCGKVLLQ